MSMWKHFSDPKKKQKISVKLEDGKISVMANDDACGPYYLNAILEPKRYATEEKQQEIHNYVKSMEKIDKLKQGDSNDNQN
tara:strand:- start:296 stop:538 length:243 start_codon:yes stop_codon:yes gene_type:complete